MLDFEKASRKALKENFPNTIIKGAISIMLRHYGIRKKVRDCKEKIVYDTYILLFAFKIYLFIPQAYKNSYLKEITDIYSQIKKNIKNF